VIAPAMIASAVRVHALRHRMTAARNRVVATVQICVMRTAHLLLRTGNMRTGVLVELRLEIGVELRLEAGVPGWRHLLHRHHLGVELRLEAGVLCVEGRLEASAGRVKCGLEVWVPRSRHQR